ncbi:MAG: amylo-alpha-1,6-glucosidase [bacterium]|nr:amylo-alpha-1,6-glucosidase [bacterium]
MKEKLENDIETLLDKEYGYLNAGFPRFMRLFGRDSLISSWQLLEINQEIAKATLKILAKLQGKKFDNISEEEPGKIIHETHPKLLHHPKYDWMPFPYYGSIDSTPLFIIISSFYLEKTNDREFLKAYRLNIESAVKWLVQKIKTDKSGLLRYQRKQERGQLFHQGWKDSFFNHFKIEPPVAIVEAQGYGYLAFKKAGQVLENEKYSQLAEQLKKRFEKKFWMSDKNYFALALDGQDNQRQAITSNPGHLLFCEILEKEKQEAVVKKLFSPELWTKYGIRTHGLSEPDFDAESYHLGSVWPHDNWIIAQGLKKCGYLDQYQKVKEAILTTHKELGYIPELYAVFPDGELKEIPKACTIQAWASGAALQFITE